MEFDDEAGICQRIAANRNIRRMSQADLADRIPFSLSLLREIEQGTHDATPAFTAAVSKALSTDVTLLTAAAAPENDETERERYFELLCVLLFAAHSVTYKTGYLDLSTVVEDRLGWAASRSSDPLMGALSAWARTASMLQNGSYDIGLRLLDRTQTEIQPKSGRQEVLASSFWIPASEIGDARSETWGRDCRP